MSNYSFKKAAKIIKDIKPPPCDLDMIVLYPVGPKSSISLNFYDTQKHNTNIVWRQR